MHVCVCVQLLHAVQLSVTPMDCSSLAPLSMGFSKQENWNGLPYLTPGDLLGSGMEPTSPALAGEFFTTEPPGKPGESSNDGI